MVAFLGVRAKLAHHLAKKKGGGSKVIIKDLKSGFAKFSS